MEQFLKAVKEHVSTFKSFFGKSVKLVSHLDSDGLSSSAIMIKALFRAVSYTHLTLPTTPYV